MKVALFTNEFPPNIYGGAGVHIDFLSRELRKHASLQIKCFGTQKSNSPEMEVEGISAPSSFQNAEPKHQRVFEALDINLHMAAGTSDVDLVHCHTWYSHFAGFMTKTLQNVPLVLTTHSLEPHRPWKVDQLGNAYHLSTWIEKNSYQHADGIIAVSELMRNDVIEAYGVDPGKVHVIHNGIDPDFYSPTAKREDLQFLNIDLSRPYILFVGRITKQKGLSELIKAIPYIDKEAQIVLCAGAPDTPEIEKEISDEIANLRKTRDGIIWIPEMLSREVLRTLYAQADVFTCPSLYEPFGIINLEAMACGTPVVASAVGGIPEIIEDGKSGFLIPLESRSRTEFAPLNPDEFRRGLANKINLLLRDSNLREQMGQSARKRAVEHFSWKSIANKTLEFYKDTIRKYHS